MNTLDFPPATFEVEDQLNRILATPRFRNAPNPSAFLELGVRRALKGKKTTGRIVAQALFGGKFIQGESSDVRVTSRNLRKVLQRYYEREGGNDVVLISYPAPQDDKSLKPVEGEAYTPLFSYNPKHKTYILIRIGHRCLEQSTYGDYKRAFGMFADLLEKEPGNIACTLGMVETLCKFADRHWENPAQAAPINSGMKLLDGLQDKAEDYWRFWAVKAYLHKGQGKNELVASFYETALRLNRAATESYLPYIEFLVDTGKIDEALGLAQRYVNERVEDSIAVAQYGQILCCTGRHDIGIGHLQAALAMDSGNCLAHETLATVRFMQKDIEGVFAHLRALKTLCDAESFERITAFLQNHEARYGLRGTIAKFLSQDTSAAAAVIVKR